MPVHDVTPWWTPPEPAVSKSTSGGISQSSSISNQQAVSQQASSGANFSQSYIPEYSQTPILESIAKQAQAMAPEVYQWGMEQYNKNQGNIDAMMRNAMTYSSPQRIASEMGRAQAGVMQGAEAGRQNAIKDLQSFGIDPSSGRYAALDQASRVMSGAAAAGAGNQQREATMATGAGMQQAAMGASLQNLQTGYGAAAGANALLNTASQLKYSPLGSMGGGTSESAGTSSSTGGSTSLSRSINDARSGSIGAHGGGAAGGDVSGGDRPRIGAEPLDGGDPTSGGFVSHELSPSAGAQVDDVQARLNAGEFVIPKDVAAWKGQEFFYKLMAQARKMRAVAGQESGQGMGYAENGGEEAPQQLALGGQVGYGAMTGGVQGPPSSFPGQGGGAQGQPNNFNSSIDTGLQDQGMAAANPQVQTFEQAPVDEQAQTLLFDPVRANQRFAVPQLGYSGYGGGYG
jgi:hypothetical protein